MNDIFDESRDIFNLNSRTSRISCIHSISEEIDFNIFGDAISSIEAELNSRIEMVKSESAKLNDEILDYSQNVVKIPSQEDLLISDKLNDYYSDQQMYMQYLTVLLEMKIVYMFKTLEINMKALIKTAYPHVITRGFYKWEDMVLFFKSIYINVSGIVGYQEVIELKKVNNCIKHKESINDEVKKIREFSSLDYFDSDSITAFSERIKEIIKKFFKGLSDQVIKDLFDFDQSRIDKICEDYSNRMDKKTFEKFIES